MFRKVTIVGVGLMGGSLGKAIKKHNLAREVVGLSLRQTALVEAIKAGAIDDGQTDPQIALRNADLVVLAAPVDAIIKMFPTINPHIKRGCIVTDLGSSKSEVVEAAEKTLSAPYFFIGGHPLVGSEKKGVENADADLFNGALIIMTPTEKTSKVVKEKMKFFWNKLGANVKILTAQEHDEALAYVSHLPHLLAFGLMETVPAQFLEFTPRSLKDTTRIASSSPQMWNDICMTNAKNVVKSLDQFVDLLGQIRLAIVERNDRALIQHFEKAKNKRDGITTTAPQPEKT